MAARMAALGVRGLVVGGRVRDVGELRRLKVKGVKEEGEGGKDGAAAAGGGPFPVYARATSTVGTGAEAKPWAREVPVDVGGVVVSPVCVLSPIPSPCPSPPIPKVVLESKQGPGRV